MDNVVIVYSYDISPSGASAHDIAGSQPAGNMGRVKAAPCIAIVLAMLGCATAHPITNVMDAPAAAGSGKALTRTEVARAIERGGRSLGWQMIVDGPGHFTGQLLLRRHVAVVAIEHDARTYSIQYRESVNLDARDGEIHAAYNRWVEKLDRAIRKELELL